jgi:hypothetical protein
VLRPISGRICAVARVRQRADDLDCPDCTSSQHPKATWPDLSPLPTISLCALSNKGTGSRVFSALGCLSSVSLLLV